MNDTGFNPACQWERLEDFPSGAMHFVCTVCGKETVQCWSPLTWIVIDWGDPDKHEPLTTPLDEWIDGLDLSEL